VIVFLVVVGSLWIMVDLNRSMMLMPQMMGMRP
jgi:heme/copper-type cytochrome/quinol oxidase subunit 4